MRSHNCRRACGSRPVVGSSRNSRSGSPTSAHASASRCFCPPDNVLDPRAALLLELHQRDDLVGRRAAVEEAAEQAQRFDDRQLVGELRLLQLDAQPLTQRQRVGGPPQPEHLDVAGVRLRQPFADLDRRRLAGAVRPQQAEAFAGAHVQLDAVDGDDVLVGLAEIGDAQGGRRPGRNHRSSLAVAAGHAGAVRCARTRGSCTSRTGSARTAPARRRRAAPARRRHRRR